MSSFLKNKHSSFLLKPASANALNISKFLNQLQGYKQNTDKKKVQDFFTEIDIVKVFTFCFTISGKWPLKLICTMCVF